MTSDGQALDGFKSFDAVTPCHRLLHDVKADRWFVTCRIVSYTWSVQSVTSDGQALDGARSFDVMIPYHLLPFWCESPCLSSVSFEHHAHLKVTSSNGFCLWYHHNE